MRNRTKSKHKRVIALLCFVCMVGFFSMYLKGPAVYATTATETDDFEDTTDVDDSEALAGGSVSLNFNNDEATLSGTLRALLILTVIALAPSILIMLTSFTRIIVVMHFTRSALGTQTAPPNQVLIGLSLFLTLFIMAPVFTEINETAIKPYEAGELTQEEALELGYVPLREFMYKQTQTKDVNLFLDIAGIERDSIEELADIPMTVLIPSFIISELRTAFIIGFLIYLPFIVIDMVVASTLMSMGMMMLPPTTISMPFKILLFILADGWNLVIGNVVKTFY